MYYLNIFFIYSFLGFIFENILNVILNSNFNSGILYGPWTFIYGFAIFAIMLINKFLKRKKRPKWQEVILFYLFATIIMTLIEYTGGKLIEILMHRVYWDYTNLKFNFGHYIALEISLLWGLFASLVNYFIAPFVNKIAKKIPKLLTFLFLILFIIDIVMTIIN